MLLPGHHSQRRVRMRVWDWSWEDCWVSGFPYTLKLYLPSCVYPATIPSHTHTADQPKPLTVIFKGHKDVRLSSAGLAQAFLQRFQSEMRVCERPRWWYFLPRPDFTQWPPAARNDFAPPRPVRKRHITGTTKRSWAHRWEPCGTAHTNAIPTPDCWAHKNPHLTPLKIFSRAVTRSCGERDERGRGRGKGDEGNESDFP